MAAEVSSAGAPTHSHIVMGVLFSNMGVKCKCVASGCTHNGELHVVLRDGTTQGYAISKPVRIVDRIRRSKV